MKKWTFIISIVLLSTACNSILRSKPAGTLSEGQMIDILIDIHLTEATLRIANDSISRLNDTTDLRRRFAQVFKKNDVSPDDFNASLNYYIQHIEELDKIYVEVINRLTVQEANLLPKPAGILKQTNRNALTRGNPALKNPWYRSLNKTVETEEIQYFDPLIYPGSTKE